MCYFFTKLIKNYCENWMFIRCGGYKLFLIWRSTKILYVIQEDFNLPTSHKTQEKYTSMKIINTHGLVIYATLLHWLKFILYFSLIFLWVFFSFTHWGSRWTRERIVFLLPMRELPVFSYLSHKHDYFSHDFFMLFNNSKILCISHSSRHDWKTFQTFKLRLSINRSSCDACCYI